MLQADALLVIGLAVMCVLSGAKAFEQKLIEDSVPAVPSCNIVTSTLLPVRKPTPGVYIRGLNVVQVDDPKSMPPSAIREISGKSNDVNCHYDGNYTYLVIETTEDKSSAIRTIIFDDSITSDSHCPDVHGCTDDFAAGHGGLYRYMYWHYTDDFGKRLVNNVALKRDPDPFALPSGWDKMTGDLNDGRFGDFLAVLFTYE